MDTRSTYLFVSPSRIYYFRKRLSAELSEALGRNDFKISLRTSKLKQAQVRGYQVLSIIEQLEVVCSMAKKHPKEIIQNILNQLVSDNVKLLRKQWSQGKLGAASDERLTSIEIEFDHAVSATKGQEPLTQRELGSIQHLKKELMTQHEVAEEELSDLSLAYLDAKSAHLAYGISLLKGQAESERLKAVRQYAPWFKEIESEESTTQAPHISDLKTQYLQEKTAAKLVKRSVKAHGKAIDYFIEICGDLKVDQIDKATGRKFKEFYQKYPKNKNKMPETKGLSLDEILAKQVDYTCIDTVTFNNNIGKISTFFNWAIDHGYLKDNPVANMKIKVKKRAKDARYPFSDTELSMLFDAERHNFVKLNKHYKFWLPLIGLYTGARIEEICQLKHSDIRSSENGIMYFNITDRNEEQNVKNDNSQRKQPIHSELLTIGLMDYIEFLKRSAKDRLFPELMQTDQGYSGSAVKWFGRYKKKLISPDREKKITFHSLRHSCTDKMREARLTTYEIEAISGRESNDITNKVYGSDLPLEHTKECIEKISFGSIIDINALQEIVSSKYRT